MLKTTTMMFVALAVFAAGMFGQNFNRETLTRMEQVRSASRAVHHGQVQTDGATQAVPAANGAKILIWSDKKFYLPGEEIKIRALGLAADATQLQIFITETFTGTNGAVSTDVYACECGDANGGYVPSLASYNFITLLNKRVPSLKIGRYDFAFSITKPQGMGPSLGYQTTQLSVYTLVSDVPDPGPIVVDQMVQASAQGPILVLVGRFPRNTPLYYFVGAAPYEGAFGDQPGVVSQDGSTLILPAISGRRLEGRVVLMLPDGSYSTTTAQTFVPTVPLTPPMPTSLQ